MPAKKHLPEEIIGKLSEVQVVLAMSSSVNRREDGKFQVNLGGKMKDRL